MRDLLVTAAGALLSLIILVNLMAPQQAAEPQSRPNSEDTGDHGQKALAAWLDRSGVDTHSLRRPWTRLEESRLPPRGNLLITSLPLLREPLDSEWQALHRWVAQGNSILVLASMYHSPEWAQHAASYSAISRISGEAFQLEQTERDDVLEDFGIDEIRTRVEEFLTAEMTLQPLLSHPLFDGVESLHSLHTPGLYAYRDSAGQTRHIAWYIDSESSRLGLRLMGSEIPSQTAMWMLPVEQGRIYLSAFTDLVSNRVIAQGDNAVWFRNLVNLSVATRGYVIFDDYHFGLSDLYDPDAFFSDERFHNTLLFIGAFWLIYAFGRSPRLAPVHSRVRKHRARDLVEAMAGFYTRRLQKRTLLRALADNTVQSLSRHTRLTGEALWSWLAEHPDVQPQDIERLQRALGLRGGRVKPFQLNQSIHRIHKVLL